MTAAYLEDLIEACIMESYFRECVAERDLLFHDTMTRHLAAYVFEPDYRTKRKP